MFEFGKILILGSKLWEVQKFKVRWKMRTRPPDCTSRARISRKLGPRLLGPGLLGAGLRWCGPEPLKNKARGHVNSGLRRAPYQIVHHFQKLDRPPHPGMYNLVFEI